MLAKKYRFHSRGGVNFVRQKGKTVRTPLLAMTYLANHLAYQRFGVVISKKVLKSAVGRNRIRRRIYEALRLELPNYSYPIDCLLIVHSRSFLTLPFTEVRSTIHDLLSRTLDDANFVSRSEQALADYNARRSRKHL